MDGRAQQPQPGHDAQQEQAAAHGLAAEGQNLDELRRDVDEVVADGRPEAGQSDQQDDGHGGQRPGQQTGQ